MPKANGSVAAALLVVLALTGCAGAPAAAPTVTVTQTADPAPSAEPLAVETPAAEPAASHESYLVAVRAELGELTQIPDATDEQLIDAARSACEQMASGVGISDVRVVEGETANDLGYFQDSQRIAAVASETVC